MYRYTQVDAPDCYPRLQCLVSMNPWNPLCIPGASCAGEFAERGGDEDLLGVQTEFGGLSPRWKGIFPILEVVMLKLARLEVGL